MRKVIVTSHLTTVIPKNHQQGTHLRVSQPYPDFILLKHSHSAHAHSVPVEGLRPYRDCSLSTLTAHALTAHTLTASPLEGLPALPRFCSLSTLTAHLMFSQLYPYFIHEALSRRSHSASTLCFHSPTRVLFTKQCHSALECFHSPIPIHCWSFSCRS